MLSGCGGGNGGDDGPRTYAIGARIDGLVGSRLALSNNGINVVVAPESSGRVPGLYSGLAAGASYDVTIATQPTNPAQTCVVTDGKGTIADADAEVLITCTTTPARYLLVQPKHTASGPSDDCIRASAIDSASGSLAAPNGTTLCGPRPASDDGSFSGAPIGPMAVHPQGKFVYLSISQSRFGCLCTFAIDADSGVVSFVQGQSILHPSSVAVHPSGQFIFFSSDGLQAEGHVSTYSVAASSGALTYSSMFALDNTYTGDVVADPLGRFVYSIFYTGSLSSTQVTPLVVDPTTGALSRVASPVTVARGLLVPHPSGKFLYVAGSGNAIAAFKVDSATGALSPVAGSPFTLPGGSEMTAAAIDPAGNYLYALDYPSNHVFAYAIDRNGGQLAAIIGSPFATGDHPLSVAIEPQGHYVYVSHDLGVSGYAIDSANGALTPISGSPFALGVGGDIAFSY